jgi:signal transduction histidine kinase
MAETQLDQGQIAFQTEGRLLQELGERLVASPQVALVELIKNAYDADARNCHVALDEHDATLVVRDDGVGMTFDQFSTRWMRIATSNKVDARSSPKFKRHLTGQKGIGRFAVRFLGQKLTLDSVAWDTVRKCNTRLLAEFDWPSLDIQEDLDKAKIPYRLLRVAEDVAHGTTLTIKSLKVEADFARSSEFRTSVLKIVSPLRGLFGGRFTEQRTETGRDPGFRVSLPDDGGSTAEELDLAGKILDHAWAKLVIDLTNDVLLYTVKFSDDYTQKLRLKIDSKIKNGLIADIRFFPRRGGVFRNTEVNGQEAWRWVRENCGIAVVDHGFRIPPYGLQDNDWLFLDADGGHNERNWRSTIAEEHFPIPAAVRHRGDNPMLNLPSNFQLVGAAFVQSTPVGSRSDNDLITSMDREGFLYNDAFEQFVDVVRGGIEFLAREDRAFTQREADKKAKEAARKTRADLRAAVEYIEKSPTLTRADKTRLVEEYSGLAKKVGEVEEYDREARRKLETMSALGVVAGFMTHESARIVSSLKEAVVELQRLVRKHPSLRASLQEIETSLRSLEAQLDYAKTFVDATQRGAAVKFKSAPQVKLVLQKFGEFARERGIEIEVDIDPGVEAPPMPITIYSGILLNLYTNALKAIMAVKSKPKASKILFRAFNDNRWHILEVLDNGIGIPPNLRGRIWDPLFTTTSRLNNPLGSGMGLGLTLVRQLVEQVEGKIDLVDPPLKFNTCFRVQFPRTAR